MKYWLSRVGRQLRQVLIAVDQLTNTLLGLLASVFREGTWWADETISAHCYRRQKIWYWRWAMYVINGLFFDRDHCMDAYQSEKMRLQQSPEYRS